MKNNSLNGGKMLKRSGNPDLSGKRNIYLAVIITALFLISGIAQAGILRVPAQYPTIQEGLNAALASDTVLVAHGTYYEHIIWPSTDSINLISEAGAEQTIIDGSNDGRVISITTGVSLDTEIRGFTIQHGYVPSPDSGAGILCGCSSPTITENIITENNSFKGGGVYCYSANPLIRDNQIINNQAYYGAGIGLRFADPVIEGNTISENHAPSGHGWAAGIDCYDASPVIIGNTISYNSCHFNGAAIYCTRSHATIQFNNILYNTAIWEFALTGGIMTYESPDLRINFNNIVGNNYGVCNNNSGDSLNAEYNWWGDPSGPGGDGPGTGDGVYDPVDYIPWLQEQAPPLPVASLPDISYGSPGDTISIPIMVSELIIEFGIVSAEFDLTYNSDILTGIDVDPSGTLLSGTDWTCEYNVVGDTFSVVMAGSDTLAGSGILINLLFVVSPDAQLGQESPLHFVEFIFNEGILAVTTQDGIFIVTSVGVEESASISNMFALNQNYPNPFSSSTTISFSLCHRGTENTEIKIYNIKGQLLKTLLPLTNYHSPITCVVWDGKDENGKQLSSGIYLYRITAGDFTDTKKCVILK